MCKYCGTNTQECGKVCARGITSQADKNIIVAKHNELRRKVAKGLETKASAVKPWVFAAFKGDGHGCEVCKHLCDRGGGS